MTTMHAILDANTFRDAATKTALVIATHNSIPVLGDILLTAENGTLRLYATDMDIEITATIPADIREQGSVTMPAKALVNWLKSTPKQCAVEIQGDTLRAGTSSTKMPGNKPEDMPIMTLQDQVAELIHPDMAGELAKVSHAISTEETRYCLNGVYFHRYGKNLRMVTTDGHRLALSDIAAPQAPNMPGVIIPRGTVTVLRKPLKSKTPIPVHYAVDKRDRMRFRFGAFEIISKAINGTFPDYEGVIPTRHTQHATFARMELADAAREFAKMNAARGGSAMRLSIDGINGAELSLSSPEHGTSQRHIAAQGDAIDIGFKPHYLAQILDAMTGEGVELWFRDSAGPVLILDPHCVSVTHVLMPCRV